MSTTRYWSVLSCRWVEWDPVEERERPLLDTEGSLVPRPVPAPRAPLDTERRPSVANAANVAGVASGLSVSGA